MSGVTADNPYRASGVIAAAGGGAISWCTTAKTGDFCAAAGSGYLVNTTSTAFTATLPASPTEGDQISFVDFAGTFDSNALTLGRSSLKIKGSCTDATVTADRGAVTIIYTGTTQGWIQTSQGNDGSMAQAEFVAATGGNQPTATGCVVCTNYKVHTFTGTGPLCISAAGNAEGSSTIDYLVIAGGAGGGAPNAIGSHNSGGGGAGGYRESSGTASGCYTISPLGTGVTALTAAVADLTLTVGAGGAGAPNEVCNSTPGVNSVFSTITSAGGGGSGKNSPPKAGLTGGSGGGGSSCGSGAGGAGNTPPTTPAQGSNGGNGHDPGSSGGGGGATAVGTAATSGVGGNGGAGATSCITASPVGRSGGGAGGSNSTGGTATDGGGTIPSMAGTANTGGGGASGSPQTPATTGGTGGSGYVVVRYKFQ